MATVTLGFGSFKAVITVNSTTTTSMKDASNITWIKAVDATGATIHSGFNPTRALAFEGSGKKYITFRSFPDDNQFPIASGGGHISDQTGQSLDVWSDQFYDDVESSSSNENTWATAKSNYDSNNSRFQLDNDKWTVFYDYDNLNAPGYNKGGNMTVTISQ